MGTTCQKALGLNSGVIIGVEVPLSVSLSLSLSLSLSIYIHICIYIYICLHIRYRSPINWCYRDCIVRI